MEPLLQVGLLSVERLSLMEPLLRYHAKVPVQVELDVAAAIDLYSTAEDTRGRPHNAFVDRCVFGRLSRWRSLDGAGLSHHDCGKLITQVNVPGEGSHSSVVRAMVC